MKKTAFFFFYEADVLPDGRPIKWLDGKSTKRDGRIVNLVTTQLPAVQMVVTQADGLYRQIVGWAHNNKYQTNQAQPQPQSQLSMAELMDTIPPSTCH